MFSYINPWNFDNKTCFCSLIYNLPCILILNNFRYSVKLINQKLKYLIRSASQKIITFPFSRKLIHKETGRRSELVKWASCMSRKSLELHDSIYATVPAAHIIRRFVYFENIESNNNKQNFKKRETFWSVMIKIQTSQV